MDVYVCMCVHMFTLYSVRRLASTAKRCEQRRNKISQWHFQEWWQEHEAGGVLLTRDFMKLVGSFLESRTPPEAAEFV